MKKRRLKRWVKVTLTIIVIYTIGIGCILLLCERAEQINRSVENEKVIEQYK